MYPSIDCKFQFHSFWNIFENCYSNLDSFRKRLASRDIQEIFRYVFQNVFLLFLECSVRNTPEIQRLQFWKEIISFYLFLQNKLREWTSIWSFDPWAFVSWKSYVTHSLKLTFQRNQAWIFQCVCVLASHIVSHGTVWLYLVTHNSMQRNKLSVARCSYAGAHQNASRLSCRPVACSHTSQSLSSSLPILSGQFLPHGLSQTSKIKLKSNLCTDVGIFSCIYLVSFLQNFHSFIYTMCYLFFSHHYSIFLKYFPVNN